MKLRQIELQTVPGGVTSLGLIPFACVGLFLRPLFVGLGFTWQCLLSGFQQGRVYGDIDWSQKKDDSK